MNPSQTSRKNPFRLIMLTALLAGTLDAIAAIVVYQANPKRMFQFIASGVFGKEAFSGGVAMALWGVLFHFFIAFCWTLFFFLLYTRVKILSANKFVVSIAYGLFIWLVMNMIVVPISHGAPRTITLSSLTGMAILIVAVALPVVWLTQHYYSRK